MPGPPFIANSGDKMNERSTTPGLHQKNNNGHGDGIVDPQLWHACAGSQVQLPQVGSSVIYFPQGHGEHASSVPEFTPGLINSTIPCRVLTVKFLADTETDEVFARITLQPESRNSSLSCILDDASSPPQTVNPAKVTSFAKTLTQSDANNGGGFSVPRYCAETIFPRLDYSVDPPVQIVFAKDIHGTVWKFRHIYRGTPRRHLLTTGWSNFVNQKKLVAGDAIVFLRSASGELCVGVRRSNKGVGKPGGESSGTWHHAPRAFGWDAKSLEASYRFLGNDMELGRLSRPSPVASDINHNNSSFTRNQTRVTAKSVIEAATLAASGQPFEVVYYPRASISEFCVNTYAVKSALQQSWAPGMRFKMAVETEDASRISWFMGTVSKVQEADPVLWPNSPWKILQVTWDEPDLLQGINRVSPWQVELVSPIQLPPFSFPKKKVRLSQPSELQLDGQGPMALTMGALVSDMPQHIKSLYGYVDSVPAGMQGARHERNYGFPIKSPKFHPTGFFLNNFYQHQGYPATPEIGAKVVTEFAAGDLTLHGLHQIAPKTGPGIDTPRGQSEMNDAGNRGGTSGMKTKTFILFGKTIDTSQSTNAHQPQMSGGNSSDSARHETASDGNKSEVYDNVNMFFPCQQEIMFQGIEKDSLLLKSGDKCGSGIGNLKWIRDPDTVIDNASNHCKVFSDSDDVGRIIDPQSFGSYEELYERLEKMFGAKKFEFLNRVVCVDSMGFLKPIGDEPYRNFMRSVRRLKILSGSPIESVTK